MAERLPATNESVLEKLKEQVKNKNARRNNGKRGRYFPTEPHNILQRINQVLCQGTEHDINLTESHFHADVRQ